MFARRIAPLVSLAFAAIGARTPAAVLTLNAVKKNDVAITPTSSIAAVPGDRIETEIRLAGWGMELPEGVQAVQATIAGSAGFRSGDNGTVLPCGWDAPLDPIPCVDSGSCPPAYAECLAACRQCVGVDHEPSQCAFITADRLPPIFCDLLPCPPLVETCTLDYRYGIGSDLGLADTGTTIYVGSLILEASANACGTFTIGFLAESTFAIGPGQTVFPLQQPLSVHVSSCVPYPIACDPAHCSIDARIAHAFENPTIRYNTHTLLMQFTDDAQGMTASDFQVALFGTGVQPSIASVTTEGNLATIVLNQRIRPEAWTCIHHLASNRRCCMGSLPGDVDRNGVFEAADLWALLDSLDGAALPPAPEQCDTDRSGLCTAGDLLTLIDLANSEGAPCFAGPCEPLLPECPPQSPYP